MKDDYKIIKTNRDFERGLDSYKKDGYKERFRHFIGNKEIVLLISGKGKRIMCCANYDSGECSFVVVGK